MTEYHGIFVWIYVQIECKYLNIKPENSERFKGKQKSIFILNKTQTEFRTNYKKKLLT